ncbi:hypothetical protein [Halomonas huangheensis]|uniref:Uncharacterized protein n=1 Tax=Halomonas huangheensis TaxID=1178482 RepID=W1N8H3_9GAMM|nr:hypothetical protein [Halomonas huangheensis]ALM53148.1 hypothetical protein AR456_13295 [Halomonas huangheensis]ERL51501.1 hypothetical protein BJB45_13865 [Halomonas huangheensis]
MMEWISNHSSFLQFMTSLATLAVWIFYAQLLLAGYLRQRRPKVVINQVMGLSTHGRCLVSNMSAEGVHIETVQVWLHDKDGVRRCTVSDLETDASGNTPTSLSEGTLQGPLPSNAHVDAGEIGSLVARARKSEIEEDRNTLCNGDDDYKLELLVLYIYSSSPGIMGAMRTFIFDDDGLARPAHVETQQLRGYRDRKKMARIYRNYLDR